jgi:hypothetical protein
MSTFSTDAIRRIRSMPITTNFYEHSKLDLLLRKVGKDTYELRTSTGRSGYKQRMRKRTIKIEPDQNYAPSDVAAFLNVSYDAALRLMLKMKGVVDLGTPTRRYKRGKKKLRISGKNLLAFLKGKTRE